MYPLSKDTILIYYQQKPAFNPYPLSTKGGVLPRRLSLFYFKKMKFRFSALLLPHSWESANINLRGKLLLQ